MSTARRLALVVAAFTVAALTLIQVARTNPYFVSQLFLLLSFALSACAGWVLVLAIWDWIKRGDENLDAEKRQRYHAR